MKRLAMLFGLFTSTVLAQTTPGPATYVQIRTAPTVGAACTSNTTVWVPSTRRSYCCVSSLWTACDAPADCAANPPVGACNSGQMCSRTDTGALYNCVSSAWVSTGAAISGAASTIATITSTGGILGDSDFTWDSTNNLMVRKLGRIDTDTNGDGTIDHRLCGDYDVDGTLEWSDIQSCIDRLCDLLGDGTQDGTALDMDADGTVGTHEKKCGTVILAPGTWVSSASATDRISIKWKGLTLLGSGIYSTIIKPSFSRATYCATLPTTRTGIIQTSDLDGVISGGTAGSSKGADFLEIGNMTIDNIGARSATAAAGSVTGGPTDCNLDGTADAGSSGEGLNNLNIKGLPGDTNADSTYDTWDGVDYVYIHDINMLNCDGACLFADESNTGKFERLSARNSSEHCYAALGNDQVWNDITGVNCGNKNWGGRGLEVYVGNVDTKRFSFSNFNLSGNIGIGIISANNSGSTPSAPAKVGDGILIQDGHVAANDVKDTGASDTGYCIQSNTASNMAGKVKNVRFDNVSLDSCSGYGVHMSQYDQNFTFANLRVKNTSYDTGATAYPAVQLLGVDMTLEDSDIELSDFAGDGTFDTLGGIDLTSCTRCRIKGNYIHGTMYPATGQGILVNSTASEPVVEFNTIDLNRGSALTNYAVGIFPKNTDDGDYRFNTIRLPAVTQKFGVYLGSGGSADRNSFFGNRVFGGSVGFYEETGAISSYTTGMFNYAAPSLAGGIGFNLSNTKDTSIWAYNVCQSPDGSACYSFGAITTAAARNVGNIIMAPKTGSGGTRTLRPSINTIEFAADLTDNNIVDTGIYLAGTTVQNISFEGATLNSSRVDIVPTDPTAARTVTIPDATGTIALNQQFFAYLSAKGAGNTGATTYLSFAGTATNTTETAVDDYLSPAASTSARNLSCVTATAPDNGAGTQTWTITLRDDGANTALTCVISEAATTCTDVANVLTIGAGSKLDLSVAPAATPAASTEILCSIGVGLI